MADKDRLTGGGTLRVPRPDTKEDPGKDFYTYVNGNWSKSVHIPAFTASYGVSEELEEEIRHKLMNEIAALRKKEPNHPLSILASSVLNTSSQQNNVVDLQRITNMFECINSVKDVCRTIGSLNRIQSRSPLTCIVGSDSNTSSECVIFLYEPKLGLPERNDYKGGRILSQYRNFLQKVGKLLNIANLDEAIDMEIAIEPHLLSNGDIHSIEYIYNPVSFKELVKTYSAIDWVALFDGWGLSETKAESARFIVTNPKYVGLLNKFCTDLNYEGWRIWFRSLVILTFVEYLPPPFDDYHFEFFERSLRGNTEKLPQKLLMLKVLQSYAPQELSRLYVERIVTPGTKEKAIDLVKRLKQATIQRLESIEWMTENTRTISIDKVKRMLFQVAYPGRWFSETKDIHLYEDRALMNIINLNVCDSEHMVKELNKRCGRYNTQWEDGAFIVNAYFYTEGNRMTIPAGMLQPPFFDVKRSNAWNYGGIGAAIGHEITHGFDDDGRKYDAEGNYNNYWTVEDEKNYKRMSRNVIKLFDKQPYMGGKVNGEYTLSENIADLGGLAIALTALNTDLQSATADEKKKAYREFFHSYAVSWRNKDRPKKAKQSLTTDVHAPASLRVNMIVRNFKEFFDAFDIHEGDAGWIPEKDRVVFW